jgi:hypothetical protein
MNAVKKQSIKSRVRKTAPRIERVKNNAVMMCPFCDIPHPISIEPGVCGTKIEISASQTIYYRGTVCALCGKEGGDMFKYGNAYCHVHRCVPGKMLLDKPKKSLTASLFYKMPNKLHVWVKEKLGRAAAQMQKDGKTVGYTWVKYSGG